MASLLRNANRAVIVPTAMITRNPAIARRAAIVHRVERLEAKVATTNYRDDGDDVVGREGATAKSRVPSTPTRTTLQTQLRIRMFEDVVGLRVNVSSVEVAVELIEVVATSGKGSSRTIAEDAADLGLGRRLVNDNADSARHIRAK